VCDVAQDLTFVLVVYDKVEGFCENFTGNISMSSSVLSLKDKVSS
jgi:hypothetical protein